MLPKLPIALLAFLVFSCVATIAKVFEQKKESTVGVEKMTGDFPEDDFIVWLGHSTFLMKLDGVVFYTDPLIYEKVVLIKRQIPFPIELEKLPPPDVILISHNHYDHMDIPSLRFLGKLARSNGKKPHVLVPQRCSYYLRGEDLIVLELPWDHEYEIKGLKIKSIKVKHFSGRNLFDWKFSLWNAYLVTSKKYKVLFQGDTSYIRPEPVEPDLAIMPIGAWQPRWFMKRNHISPCEAVQMAYEMKAKIMLPMHYGTFSLGSDTPEESIAYMVDCAKKLKVNYLIPKVGEILVLDAILDK